MTLLDTTMARAAMSKQNFLLSVVSTGVSVNFLKPGRGRLTTTARVTGGGKSICFCEGEVIDESGQSVAKALGTFKYRLPPDSQTTQRTMSNAEIVE